MNIDLCIIATIRPNILERTLQSFYDNLFFPIKETNINVHINVDPVGDLKYTNVDIISVVGNYFSNVHFNFSKKPNFSKAVQWVWKQCKHEYLFHLEDDWVLNRKIDLNHMVQIMNNNNNLATLRFSKYSIPNSRKIVLFNSVYTYNDQGFYVAKNRKTQFGLNPVLIRKKFVDQSLPHMKDDINPEKQFRPGTDLEPVISNWDFAIYSTPGKKALVSDIGRRWRQSKKLSKPSNKQFLTWRQSDVHISSNGISSY